MVLSSDLISKFVKATKDEPQTKKETVVYGMVTQTEPDVRVKLFDSNSDTLIVHGVAIPVASQTTVVEVGDKVECTIKNHKLSITGTSEHPAARDSSTINVSQLNASNARIDNLESANIDVQDTLTAHNADIDNLKAANVDITGRLTAAEADIDYLQALDIDVETLNAAKAFVEDLKASDADINYLVSTVAEIDTLMFGSASGNVIQTSFSNAVIAQLGDAQIKSAMIESISAGKITAGDIITNNVRVMSEDGSLIISDETLQISDSNRVRVQIGKDASNDYSINIWDQNGHLMFSKGGITDAAIKEAIIRNDMVSDTANIHASKLDIDSLFEEINDSSNTIKSTQVKLDDRNQTLDVAFKSLTNEISSQGNKISSQGTAISTIQGQIASKVWQQDINTAKNEMSTQYSTLEQDVDSFKTTVSKTYATISDTTNLNTRMTTVEQTADSLSVELENLEIGGRNILLKSDFSNKTNTDNFTYNSSERMVTVTSDTLAQTMTSSLKISNYGKNKLSGSIIVISGEYKIPTTLQYGNTNPYIGIELALIRDSNTGGSSQWMSWFGGTTMGSAATDGWVKYTQTLRPSNYDFSQYNLHLILRDFVGTVQFRNLKIEFGNKATDWTPAPEDIESDILDSSKTATNYLEFSSSGLVIGDLTSSTLGKNVLIDSDSVDIRNGDTTLASFGADYLYLAKNSRNAKIDLCNGLAQLYHQSKYSYDTLFVIDTPNATEIQGTYNPLCVTSTVSGKVSIQFANTSGVIGSIGMVESGTESYITRNHPSTAATYSILDTGNYYKIMDSGWINCTLNTGTFTRYSNDIPQPQVRKIGKQVYLRGEAKPSTSVTPENDQDTVIATIPSGYRPKERKQFIMQGSAAYRWLMGIHPDGTITISRYSNSTTVNMPVSAGAWLCCHAQWLIE